VTIAGFCACISYILFMLNFIERGLYAVLPGAAIFFLFVEQTDKEIIFMHLPDNHKIVFEYEDLSIFLTQRKLDLVEQLPVDVYNTAVANII